MGYRRNIQGIHGSYLGDILGIFWGCIGCIMVIYWYGVTMGISWGFLVDIFEIYGGLSWKYLGDIFCENLKIFWDIWGRSGGNLGDIWGISWVYLG